MILVLCFAIYSATAVVFFIQVEDDDDDNEGGCAEAETVSNEPPNG